MCSKTKGDDYFRLWFSQGKFCPCSFIIPPSCPSVLVSHSFSIDLITLFDIVESIVEYVVEDFSCIFSLKSFWHVLLLILLMDRNKWCIKQEGLESTTCVEVAIRAKALIVYADYQNNRHTVSDNTTFELSVHHMKIAIECAFSDQKSSFWQLSWIECTNLY